MPPKVRDLIRHLESVGFVNRGGKGSHRNYKHPQGINVTISGKLGDDAKRYQEQAIKNVVKQVKHP